MKKNYYFEDLGGATNRRLFISKERVTKTFKFGFSVFFNHTKKDQNAVNILKTLSTS